MKSHFEVLDHLMFGAGDLEAASAEWSEIGFNVGPITAMPSLGFQNRRIMFRQLTPFAANFIEFLEFTREPNTLPPVMHRLNRRLMDGENGPNALIFATRDTDSAVAHFEALDRQEPNQGWKPELLVGDFDAPGPDGAPLRVKFRNCLLPHLDMSVPVSISQIQSWDFYQNPAWLEHANGADSMVGVTIVSEAPQAEAQRYAAITARDAFGVGDEVVSLELPHVDLTFMSPKAFIANFGVAPPDRPAPFIAAMTLTTQSMASARELLGARAASASSVRIVTHALPVNAIVIEFIPA